MDEKESGIVILTGETPIGKSLFYTGLMDKIGNDIFDPRGYPIKLSGKSVISGESPKEKVAVLKQGMYDCHRTIIGEITKTVKSLFKDKGYEGCRTPEPFRNDKGIYRQHKRQRKHK